MDRRVAAAIAAVAVSAAAYAMVVSLPVDVPAVDAEQIDPGQNVRTTNVTMWEYKQRQDGMGEYVRIGRGEVSVYVDRLEYGPGEAVGYSITNHGPGDVRFGNMGMNFEVRDLFGNAVFGIYGEPIESSLSAGATFSSAWNQQIGEAEVQPSTYVVSFGGIKSQPFTITHDNPAFHEPPTVKGESLEILVEKRWYGPGEEVRSALVNTGTEEVGSKRWIEASVVDASGAVVDEITYYSWDDIIEPGERLQSSIEIPLIEPPQWREYHIVMPDGIRSAPFVIG